MASPPARPRAVPREDALPYGSAGTRLLPGAWTRRTAPDRRRAIGSAGERLVHTEEVTGSIPVSPTRSEAMWVFIKDYDGSHSCSANRYAAGHGGQARAKTLAARLYGLYAYVVLSLLVGVRTEEARALRWDHADLAGDPTPTRQYLPVSTCGARSAPMGTPRPRSPAPFGNAHDGRGSLP